MNEQKYFLKQVVCFRTVMQNSVRDCADHAGVTPEKHGERFPASLTNLRNQGFIGELGFPVRILGRSASDLSVFLHHRKHGETNYCGSFHRP